MGRKKIQITRIMDERNRQVSGVYLSQYHCLHGFLMTLPPEGYRNTLNLQTCIKRSFDELQDGQLACSLPLSGKENKSLCLLRDTVYTFVIITDIFNVSFKWEPELV